MTNEERRCALLYCAVAPPEEAHRAWLELWDTGELADMGHRARRLLPAIRKNLSDVEDFPGLPLCEEASQKALNRNLSLREGCSEALELLESAGVEVMLLKGLYLNEALYEDLSLRYSSDFDLLVRFEQAEQACAALESAGWKRELSIEPQDRLEHGVDFHKGPWKLDLHWFLLREARNPGQDQPFWERRERVDLKSFSAYVPSATHQLFHLMTLAMREPHTKCRYLLDIKELCEKWEQRLDYVELERLFVERRILSRWTTLPLELIGRGEFRPQSRPTLLDWLWSHCSGTRFDRYAEFYYTFFPFLDYWFHFRGQRDFFGYLAERLEIESWGEFLKRSLWKLGRLLKLSS